MSTLRLPGFTADVAIGKTVERYTRIASRILNGSAVHPAVITVHGPFATPGGRTFTAVCDSDKKTCTIFYSDGRVIFDFGA